MKATLSGCIGTPSKSVKNQASLFKGTVSLTSSDPACKNDNAWFTMVPLKPCLN